MYESGATYGASQWMRFIGVSDNTIGVMGRYNVTLVEYEILLWPLRLMNYTAVGTQDDYINSHEKEKHQSIPIQYGACLLKYLGIYALQQPTLKC